MTHDPKDLILKFGEKHKHVDQLKFISECGDKVRIELIEGLGLINYIYLVQSPDKHHSVIIKYGEEKAAAKTIKHLTYTLERQPLEYNCLKLVDKFCPGNVPTPYVYDRDMHILALEYIEDAETFQKVLIEKELSLDMATELGKILGRLHFHTHRNVVCDETWDEYKRTAKNKAILENMLTVRFAIFENYKRDDTLILPIDKKRFIEIKSEINSKHLFDPVRELFEREDCLGHVDAHSLAVLISKDKCWFIDFEFGGLCSHGLSLGTLMTSYYLAMFDVRHKMEDKDKLLNLTKQAMREMVKAFLNEFKQKADVLGPIETFMAEMAAVFGHFVFVQSLYFCRKTWYIATNEDVLRLMEKGFYIMKNHKEITSMDKFIQIVFDG